MKIDTIYKTCKKVFECEIKTPSRKGKAPEGRATFYFYCKEYYPKITHDELGKYMAGRDHSTVTNALKKLEETYKPEKEFEVKFERVGKLLEKMYNKEEKIQVEETPEQFETRLLKKEIKDKERELDKLRKRTNRKFDNEIKRMLALIPEHKHEHFKETRLKPYLKMNAI
jgi:predicted ATP-dependent protease